MQDTIALKINAQKKAFQNRFESIFKWLSAMMVISNDGRVHNKTHDPKKMFQKKITLI